MELWDLYDEHHQPTGEKHIRGIPVPAGRYHTIIGVWTLHQQLKKILVTKRAPTKEICPNQWENTGGSVVSGEDVCIGAAREVREETGLDCACYDLEKIQSLRTRSAFVECFIFRTTAPPDSLVLQEGETVDYRWVTLEELEGLIADGTFSEPEIEQFNACRQALAEALASL